MPNAYHLQEIFIHTHILAVFFFFCNFSLDCNEKNIKQINIYQLHLYSKVISVQKYCSHLIPDVIVTSLYWMQEDLPFLEPIQSTVEQLAQQSGRPLSHSSGCRSTTNLWEEVRGVNHSYPTCHLFHFLSWRHLGA